MAWSLTATIGYSAAQWAMIVVVAKLGTPEMVGAFGLALAISAPIMRFASFQVRAVKATDTSVHAALTDYLAFEGIAGLLAFGLVTGIALLKFPIIAPVVVAVALMRAVDLLAEVLQGFQQQKERLDRVAVSLLMRGWASVAALILGLVATDSLSGAVICAVLVRAAVFLAYDLPVAGRERGFTSPADDRTTNSRMKRLASIGRLTLPLGVVSMLAALIDNLPRYFVARYASERELGIFIAISSLALVSLKFVEALCQACVPRLARYASTGNSAEFAHLFLLLSAGAVSISLCGVIVASTIGRPLLQLLYAPDYALHNDLLILMMAVMMISAVALATWFGLTAIRSFDVQVPLFSATAAVLFALLMLLMPGNGLHGAVIAFGGAMAVQTIASGILLVRYIRGSQQHCLSTP